MESPPRVDGPTRWEKIKGLMHFGFVPPPFDGMQVYARIKFLFDCVVKYASRSTGVALEIGCYKGCSTVVLAKACLMRGIDQIFSVDLFTGSPSWGQAIDTEEVAKERLRRYDLTEAVTLVRGDSQVVPWSQQVDVLHIDGDHEYKAVNSDLARFLPYVAPGGVVIMDDYDLDHPGVKRSVDEDLVQRDDFELADAYVAGSHSGSICFKRKPIRRGTS